MNLEFLNPEYFILLAIIPLIVLWNYLKRDNLTNSIKFSNSEAFGDSGNFYSKLKSTFKFLRLISLILVIIALARPQVIDTSTRVKTNSGIDIIMAIDVSASMLAKDLKPNRLDALKNVADEFRAYVKGLNDLLIKKTGGYKDDGNELAGADNKSVVSNIMLFF